MNLLFELLLQPLLLPLRKADEAHLDKVRLRLEAQLHARVVVFLQVSLLK